jgi:hypothetical protein
MLTLVMRSFLRCLLLATSIHSWGCAVGNKYSYDSAIAELSYSGNTVVAVATHDQRSTVRRREKSPNYVGTQRGGFANPFDVTTASGKSLADDMTTSIASSLTRQGFRIGRVATGPSDSTSALLKKFAAAQAERLLLLTIFEWYTDTLVNIGLYYDLDLRVMDTTGKVLAKRRLEGNEDFEGRFANAPARARRVVPLAFKEKL